MKTKEQPVVEQPNLRVCKRKAKPIPNWFNEIMAMANYPTTRVETRPFSDAEYQRLVAGNQPARIRAVRDPDGMVRYEPEPAPRPARRHSSDTPFDEWSQKDRDYYTSNCQCRVCVDRHSRDLMTRAVRTVPGDEETAIRERAQRAGQETRPFPTNYGSNIYRDIEYIPTTSYGPYSYTATSYG